MGFHYPPVSINSMPPYIYHNVGATQGIPAQAQVVTPVRSYFFLSFFHIYTYL
ncbi:hypothetical protein B0F90DRAFT_1696820 [Multifurca ochricompacta]|uniref:Uncharacterized protein n=1 Tax=Multifurca ochricompacta TaxID=376703 RepID=A0AAD4QNT6_9AGAM|nr:hypothetical protein B0F90DRAFT_1696820 [Multifurca ochricompacta]